MSARDEFDPVAQLRVPPHNEEAEQSVLGGLLLDNRAWDRVGDLLTADSFYAHRHRLVFEAIAGLVNACKPADVVTVNAELRIAKQSDVDLAYLNALAQSVPSAANVRRYAEIVAERHLEREMIATADEVATLAWQGEGTAQQKLDRAATLFLKLEAKRNRASAIRPLSELVVERMDHLSALHEGAEEAQAWSTPLPALNRFLAGGMRPGRVYVVAARPSIGKSAFAQTLAVQFAVSGLPVLFLSQEMPSTQLADRIIAQLCAVDFGHLQTASLSDHEWGGVSYGVETASKLPFFVDDTPALTIGQIRAKARQVKDLRVLVVDYLQLTASTPNPRGQSNRNSEIEEVSRGLKQLAKELGIAVVLLSQLNREVEKRPGKKPTVADLRDSGAIEQDADTVLLLWPLAHSPQEGITMIGVDVAKNRDGPKGEFPTTFQGRLMRWGEADLPMTSYTRQPGTGSDL